MNANITTKWCTKCLIDKPSEEFFKHRTKCKACFGAMVKDYRSANRDSHLLKRKKYRVANRERIANYQKEYYKANNNEWREKWKTRRSKNAESIKNYRRYNTINLTSSYLKARLKKMGVEKSTDAIELIKIRIETKRAIKINK